MNSDAIENPSDRTFGGMASESDAKMPGPRSAAMPEIKTLAMTATASTGASAKATHAPAMPTATIDSRRRPSPGSRSMRREASGMPMRMPMTWAGSVTPATKPRCDSERLKTSS